MAATLASRRTTPGRVASHLVVMVQIPQTSTSDHGIANNLVARLLVNQSLPKLPVGWMISVHHPMRVARTVNAVRILRMRAFRKTSAMPCAVPAARQVQILLTQQAGRSGRANNLGAVHLAPTAFLRMSKSWRLGSINTVLTMVRIVPRPSAARIKPLSATNNSLDMGSACTSASRITRSFHITNSAPRRQRGTPVMFVNMMERLGLAANWGRGRCVHGVGQAFSACM